MNLKATEARLSFLSDLWVHRRDEEARAEYQALHPLWVEAKRKAGR